MTARLAVLIVNWNRRDDLLRLLQDLTAQTRPPDEIIIVDNGSTDGTPDYVARNYPSVHLIRLNHNTGLSHGRNVGITASHSDLIAVLDNDLRILDHEFISKLHCSVEEHPDCGIISFHCVDGIWSPPGPAFRGTLLTMQELESLASEGKAPVPPRAFYEWFFWGGASVVRRQVFETVGLFDATFGYGGEEWDFAYRCHAAEIRLLRDQSLWVIHLRSPQMRSKVASYLILKNMVIAQARYMPIADLCLFLLIQFLKSSADALFAGTLVEFVKVLWQIGACWQSQVLAKRKPVSPKTMQRFYFLRTYQPEAFKEVVSAHATALDLYQNRIRQHRALPLSSPTYIAMFE